MKVLITGGAGFIGGHAAVAFAERGYHVTIADNFARARHDSFLRRLAARVNVEVTDIDLLQPDAVRDVPDDFEMIVHLAAIIGVRHVNARPYATLCDNTAMTANAIEIARCQSALTRFVFASTSEVTAAAVATGAGVPTPEETTLVLPELSQQRTTYMLSKVYGEAMTVHAGLPYTIIRPHNVYGPRMGMSHVVPELMKRAAAAEQNGCLEVYSPSHSRAFCYVDDAVAQLCALTESRAGEGGTFNVGNQDEEIAVADLARRVCGVTGRNDLRVAEMADTPGSPPRRCPDMTRTIETTGLGANTPLSDGLQLTYAWYRDVFAEREVSAL